MKRFRIHIGLLFSLLLLGACDAGFDDLNTNRIAPTEIDPAFILNTAMINSSFPTSTVIYETGIVQQVITPFSGVLTGANYNQDNRDATQGLWQRYYRSVVRNTVDVLALTEGDPDRNNLRQMARIWQAYAFLVLTDTYGDVPYSEGGRGFTEQITFPTYDRQQSIYTSLIQELREASAALTPGGRVETADVLYGGDVEKWRRLGYSLMLRAAMRLSKVAPSEAQQHAQAAFIGGVMSSNDDNCVIRHDNNYTNGIGGFLNGSEANNFYLAAPFVSHLQQTSDPRLRSIAVRYVGATSGPDQNASRADTDPAVQVGMPLGYDNTAIQGIATGQGLASFYDYSQVDRTRLVKIAAPMFLVTAAQTQLLLAEAAQRGWVTGDAATYYAAGVRAHMEQMAIYDPAAEVPADDIEAYLAAQPYDAANALAQINTQYWIASFLNGPEAFANFRRSGFPQLTPNPFPGKDISGDFIRRLTYPNSEISVNTTNVNAAISAQGPDNLDTRMWWDN